MRVKYCEHQSESEEQVDCTLIKYSVCVRAPTHPPKATHTKPLTPKQTFSCMFSMPRIPLVDDLTASQVPPGSNILVEFDPTS